MTLTPALLPSPAGLDLQQVVPSCTGRGWPQGWAGMSEKGLHGGGGASSAPSGLFLEEQIQLVPQLCWLGWLCLTSACPLLFSWRTF